jgi:hypothetical protein
MRRLPLLFLWAGQFQVAGGDRPIQAYGRSHLKRREARTGLACPSLTNKTHYHGEVLGT